MRETMQQIMAGVEHVGKAKRIANNTFRYTRPDGTEVIRFHRTDIIETVMPTGSLGAAKTVLDSGGWKTVTTKERINRLTDYRVWSEKGVWIVHGGEGQSVPFYDGMILPDAFNAGYKHAVSEREEKAQRALAKAINAFAARIPLDGPACSPPGNGDCWHCLMFDRATAKGAKVCDASHLRSHVDEGYLHGSLVVNALQWAGYGPFPIQMAFEPRGFWNTRNVVRRYLRSQLGLAT